ncbi:hypothetical protein [Candidatus Mycoplasma pogonae]
MVLIIGLIVVAVTDLQHTWFLWIIIPLVFVFIAGLLIAGFYYIFANDFKNFLLKKQQEKQKFLKMENDLKNFKGQHDN